MSADPRGDASIAPVTNIPQLPGAKPASRPPGSRAGAGGLCLAAEFEPGYRYLRVGAGGAGGALEVQEIVVGGEDVAGRAGSEDELGDAMAEALLDGEADRAGDLADEIEALASSLGHRSPDRVAADLRDLSSQMEEVGLGTSGFVNGWIRQRAEDEARRQEVQALKRRNAL